MTKKMKDTYCTLLTAEPGKPKYKKTKKFTNANSFIYQIISIQDNIFNQAGSLGSCM